MKRYFLIAFLIITTKVVLAQIPIDSIKAIIKQEVAAKRSKSIIVGIVNVGGRQIVAEGVISDKNPVLPDENTIYEIGSITKVFTTLLLADMSLKQQLDLNDPISKFLPENIKAPVRNGKEISLLSLSTHRSGLPRTAFNLDPVNLDNPYADYTTKQLYEFISTYQLGRDVDTKWAYSNIGYALLGHIEEIVAHADFKTLVSGSICNPLHMNNTTFSLPAKRGANVAIGYSECGTPAANWDFPLAGGGGLFSNLDDMLTFAEANLGFTKTGLLPAIELTHVLQAKKDGNDTYTTMGWTLSNDDGKYILFKDGGTGGYRTFIGIDKINKVGVVVLSNSNNIVTDIGWHILDSTRKVVPYKYPWALLDTLRTIVHTRGVDTAIALYQQLRSFKNASFIFNENQLNYLGSELRRNKKMNEAIKLFELNVKEYPASTLVYESLGETYKRSGNKTMAIKYFEKAAELDPQNPHWTYMLKKLKQE